MCLLGQIVVQDVRSRHICGQELEYEIEYLRSVLPINVRHRSRVHEIHDQIGEVVVEMTICARWDRPHRELKQLQNSRIYISISCS